VPAGDLIDVLIKILAGVAPVVGGLAIWAVAKYVRLLHVEKDLTAERQAREAAEARLTEARDANEAARKGFVADIDRRRAKYAEAYDKFVKLREAYFGLRQRLDPGGDGDLATVTRERDSLATELAAVQQQVAELEARIAEITWFDGRLWLRPPTDPVPAFRPLAERKTVVIAVLNLKGGVGKTTLTANLAATYAAAGKPALVIDLDYQRSLSMLLVPDKERKLLHRGGLSVQHFLGGERHAFADLWKMKHDLPAKSAIVTNSDASVGAAAEGSLDETETRLMIEWLADRSKPDPRFFLREALHEPGVGRHVGYVFLDCPPRLTTACVNALAASDYVLIPVVPDAVSTHAAENLLRALGRFKSDLLPELTPLALVPNMVRLWKDAPIQSHKDALIELKNALAAVWPDPVPVTAAVIKHDTAFGQAAAALDTTGEVQLAIEDEDIRLAFKALARELEKEIDRHARRRTPSVPDQSPAGARSGG
jgi:cellulose biosynthesis protein BcsQ